MKLGLINSAWAQAGKGTAYGIRMTKEIGFDSIDIFTDPLDIDIRERRRIKRECDKAGLPIVSVACVAVGLVDFNPSVQRFHVERCRKYLDLCYEFEARNLLLVPLDRRREWYRYHHLLRDLLRSELRRREPDLIQDLHFRAAAWFERAAS